MPAFLFVEKIILITFALEGVGVYEFAPFSRLKPS